MERNKQKTGTSSEAGLGGMRLVIIKSMIREVAFEHRVEPC